VIAPPQKPATYLTVRQVNELLGLGDPGRVLGWIHAGELSAVDVSQRRGGRPRWRIAESDLEVFLLRRRSQSAAPATTRRRRRQPEGIIQFF
jgi:hypothetical protein